MQEGTTGLFLAAREGHVDVVRALLRAGADSEQTATDGPYKGVTPAFVASARGHSEIVRLLVSPARSVRGKSVRQKTKAAKRSRKKKRRRRMDRYGRPDDWDTALHTPPSLGESELDQIEEMAALLESLADIAALLEDIAAADDGDSE